MDAMSDEGRGCFPRLLPPWARGGLICWRSSSPEPGDASIAKLGDLSGLGAAIDHYGRGYAFEAVRCKLLFPARVPAFSFSSPGLSLGWLLVHEVGYA